MLSLYQKDNLHWLVSVQQILYHIQVGHYLHHPILQLHLRLDSILELLLCSRLVLRVCFVMYRTLLL